MALDVETPAPPDLTNRPLPSALDPAEDGDATSDLRREELEAMLREGAWHEAFQEWAEYSDLSEAEYRTVADDGLVEGVDIFWDPTEAEISFEVPDLPDEMDEEFSTRVRTELTDLGRTVVEMLKDSYVDWDDGASSDTWSEETFRDETPLE